MNLAKRTVIVAVGALLAGATLRGDVAGVKDNPYRPILDMNPFRLEDPPPLTKKTATNTVNLDVRVTGTTSVGGTRRAWLVILPGPGRSQLQYLNNLSEGDVHGVLQIVEINEKEETVKILNAGIIVTLNFREHGLPAPVASVVPCPLVGVSSHFVPALSAPFPDGRPASTTLFVPPHPVTRVLASGPGSGH